jgi:hypothetical protein
LRLLYDAGDCPNANCVSFSYVYGHTYGYSHSYVDSNAYANAYANAYDHLPARERDHE